MTTYLLKTRLDAAEIVYRMNSPNACCPEQGRDLMQIEAARTKTNVNLKTFFRLCMISAGKPEIAGATDPRKSFAGP